MTYFYNLFPLNGGDYVFYQASNYSWTDNNNFILFNASGEVVNTLYQFNI